MRKGIEGLSIVELLAIIALLVVLAAVLLPALAQESGASGRVSCANNLKQMGLTMKMYANEHQGYFPHLGYYNGGAKHPEVDCGDTRLPASTTPVSSQGRLYFGMDMDDVFPNYLDDFAVFRCPSASFDEFEATSINPVSRMQDVALHCDAPCRGPYQSTVSYTYLGYAFDKLSESETISAASVPAPFRLWPLAIGAWDAAHPDMACGSRPDCVLNTQFAAWASIVVTSAMQEMKVTEGDVEHPDFGYTESLLDGAIHVGSDSPHRRLLPPGTWEDFSVYSETGYLGTGGTNTIERLSENIVRFMMITDGHLNGKIGPPAVMWDHLTPIASDFNHAPGGMNTLYMDGHVSFTPFPDESGEHGLLRNGWIWASAALQVWQETSIRSRSAGDFSDECPEGVPADSV